MSSDYLNTDLAICEIDPVTNEIKATPYFEDYLFKIVNSLGGEGSTALDDITAVALEADKAPYFFSLVKRLAKQVDEISNTIDSPILDAKVKGMQAKLGELENHFDHSRLEAIVRQLEIDTIGFIGKVKIIDYTAENKDWVEARNRITVNLPADPLVNHQVIVSNGDGSLIKIKGNGNNIKYTATDSSVQIANQGTSLHFQLFEDQSTKYWRIR